MQARGKGYSSSFFLCAQNFVEKRFGAGARGVPEPIQPMSLLNLGLWRLLAGFFPKAGIRLPLLRNFRNRRKRLQRIFDTLRELLRKLYEGSENACVKRVLLHATQFKGSVTALRTSGLQGYYKQRSYASEGIYDALEWIVSRQYSSALILHVFLYRNDSTPQTFPDP